MSQGKVLPTHLKRQAVIYVRQSSPQQVERHAEGRLRQYQMVERAETLGWPRATCLVIDDDQGRSGAHSRNRPGYQRLVSAIALREVGIVFGLEVSRLARNSLDWYQLLELAAAFDVLIADEDALYDPGDFNDRLLLGLKGTISEVELYQIRARMGRGRLNKARRGELAWPPPIGLDHDPLTGAFRLAVDAGVRHALERVFDLFRQLRSIRGVLQALRAAGLELPYRRVYPGVGTEVAWRKPSYDALYRILTNPAYAGVYVYGRRRRETDPVAHTVRVRRRGRGDEEVVIPDHHPGYLSLAEFEANQRSLAENRQRYGGSRGAAGRGPALLQGLVWCQQCGVRMRISYSKGAPSYTCDRAHRRFGEPLCTVATAKRVDAVVEELFLLVVNPATLALSQSYHERLEREVEVADRGWQDKLKRLAYQAELARRRYEQVDPANRLVAQTLETEWNQRLVELEEGQRTFAAQRPTEAHLASTAAQMREVVARLREHWYAEGVTAQDKKELLRCLMEQVFLERNGKMIRVRVAWFGGAVSELEVPKYLFSAPHLYHQIKELARTHTDQEIAALLNQAGVTTVKGKSWTARRVMDFRCSNAIPSGFTASPTFRLPDGTHISTAEAAARLGVNQSTVQHWYRLGILQGKQDGRQAALWIRWTEDVERRLGGGATPDPRMVSTRRLCRTLGKGWGPALIQAQAEGHQIYRLRRGTVTRFYILPADAHVRIGGEEC